MLENFEHLITKNIKTYYRKRIWAPIIYILVLLACWFLFSMSHLIWPTALSKDADLDYFYSKESHFVQYTFEDLTFTGHIATSRGRTTGYYYYTPWGDKAMIVLLSPSTCEQGLPTIERIHVRGKLINNSTSYGNLLTVLAEELNWTKEGIDSELPDTFFSEPANHNLLTNILFTVYFVTLLFAIGNLVTFLIHYFFPVTAPAVTNLITFGNPKRQLEEAEEELATLPQLATEDMFITEHYFIMTSPDANAIVPIDKILWIYKHSTLHKFLWYHFSISYTMHIYAENHLYIHCPKNIKSDIDGIMDYLSEANHDIVVGFSEENRLRVQERTGKPFHLEKISAFFHRKKMKHEVGE